MAAAINNYSPVINDVSDTVKAWVSQVKQNFGDPDIISFEISSVSKNIPSSITDVLVLRSFLTQSYASEPDLQECSRALVKKLDNVSGHLGFDTAIRDAETGSLLRPNIQIPNVVIAKTKSNESSGPSRPLSTQPSHIVVDFVSAKLSLDLAHSMVTSQLHLNFFVLMPSHPQSPDIRLSSSGIVAEGEMTESFNIVWDRSDNTACDSTWKPKKRFVFDISSFHWPQSDKNSNRLFLVCVAYRSGTMKGSLQADDSQEHLTKNMRRPIGIAVRDLFPSSSPSTKPPENIFSTLKRNRRQSQMFYQPVETPTPSGDVGNLLSWHEPNSQFITMNFTDRPTASLSEAATLETAAINNFHINLQVTPKSTRPVICSSAALTTVAAETVVVEPSGFSNEKIISGKLSKFYINLLEGFLSKFLRKPAEVEVYLIKDSIPPPNPISLFRSSVHDTSEKVVWNETFSIDVEVEQLEAMHLLFLVRGRSPKIDSDKRAERDRVFAILPLIEACGPGLIAKPDQKVSLSLFRFSNFREPNRLPPLSLYKNLPWNYDEFSAANEAQTGHRTSILGKSNAGGVPCGDGVDLCTRSFIRVQSKFCSHQLAQSRRLAEFLSLRPGKDFNFKANLQSLAFLFVDPVETESWVRLIFPCLDKIFELICWAGQRQDDELEIVFIKCLCPILSVLLKSKANNSLPGKYLSTAFCAPNVFLPLVDHLNSVLTKCSSFFKPNDVVVYVVKFAIKSFRQFEKVNPEKNSEKRIFIEKLTGTLKISAGLCGKDTQIWQRCFSEVVAELRNGGFCDEKTIFETIIKDIVSNKSNDQETLDFFRVLARSNISACQEGERILLPVILAKCSEILDSFSTSLPHRPNNKTRVSSMRTHDDAVFAKEAAKASLALMVLQEVVANGERTADKTQFVHFFRLGLRIACLPIHHHPNLSNDHWIAADVVLSCGKLLTVDVLRQFFSKFPHSLEICDFLRECIQSIKRMFSNDNTHVRRLGATFLYMRNAILAQVLFVFASYMTQFLLNDTCSSVHENYATGKFINTLVCFVLQPEIEAERSSEIVNFQSQRFSNQIGDLRLTVADILLQFWNNLGRKLRMTVAHVLFQLEASIVQVALSFTPRLRRIACIILKDIFQLEFEANAVDQHLLVKSDCVVLFLQGLDFLAVKRPQVIQAFKRDFIDVFSRTSQTAGAFVRNQENLLLNTVEQQMVFLEDYIAACMTSPVAELTCLRRLIEFYKNNGLSPYITHLTTLYRRQLSRCSFAEAAVALEQLAESVSWNEDPLPVALQSLTLVSHSGTQWSFKEGLFEKAAELYQDPETNLFERAIDLYRKLMTQHSTFTFNYGKLANVYEALADLTRRIATTVRTAPLFFWVTFVGNAETVLPSLQNTSFVFRAPPHKMIGTFAEDFKGWFPGVPIKHEAPPLDPAVREKQKPTIYIVKVDPDSADEVRDKFRGNDLMKVPERVVCYYRVNNVPRFNYVRRRNQSKGSLRGEIFEVRCLNKMPYMLEWAEVQLEEVVRREIDAVQLAFNDVSNKTVELRTYLDMYQLKKNEIHNSQQDLQLVVGGIVSANVGGGIKIYKPFFIETASMAADNISNLGALRQLYNAIIEQSSLVAEGMNCLETVMCVNVPECRDLYDLWKTSEYPNYLKQVASIKEWPHASRVVSRPLTARSSRGSNVQSRQFSQFVPRPVPVPTGRCLAVPDVNVNGNSVAEPEVVQNGAVEQPGTNNENEPVDQNGTSGVDDTSLPPPPSPRRIPPPVSEKPKHLSIASLPKK